MSEEWRPVVGFEGLYEVSSEGRVRSLPRYGTCGVVLKPYVGNRGYLTVNPARGGKNFTRTIHRLVAEAFLGPRPDGLVIRHLNGNRADPRLANLVYGTPTENQLDSVHHGTHAKTQKTHCPSGHEYTEENIRRIPSRPNARYCRSCEHARGKGPGVAA